MSQLNIIVEHRVTVRAQQYNFSNAFFYRVYLAPFLEYVPADSLCFPRKPRLSLVGDTAAVTDFPNHRSAIVGSGFHSSSHLLFLFFWCRGLILYRFRLKKPGRSLRRLPPTFRCGEYLPPCTLLIPGFRCVCWCRTSVVCFQLWLVGSVAEGAGSEDERKRWRMGI